MQKPKPRRTRRMPRKRSDVNVHLTPNQYFAMARENSWDLPSALHGYCHAKRVKNCIELPMHARDISEEQRDWLKRLFGRIPSELLRDDWDT